MMKKHEDRMRRMLLLLLSFAMLMSACPARGEDALPENPYRIVLTAPSGWTNHTGAVVKAAITDVEHIGWQRIEYRMNDGLWTDCEALFDGMEADITVHENGLLTLRITDPYDRLFEEEVQVNSIDLAALAVTGGAVLLVLLRRRNKGVRGKADNDFDLDEDDEDADETDANGA